MRSTFFDRRLSLSIISSMANSSASQSAYNRAEETRASSDARVFAAMYRYLREDLGLSEAVARSRADREKSREGAKNVCAEIEQMGIVIPGKRVLDLGAGLGGLSAEIAARGGNVVAIEPGSGWRKLAAERLAGNGLVLAAYGEHLPIRSNSIDLIVSLQVLEHVQDPPAVIREAFRVLKPGGYFYAAYENYLSFWEPHYRVRWLPLLPKPIGAAYLRLLGRSPQFLMEAITYTTFPGVRRAFSDAGFECKRRLDIQEGLRGTKSNLKWKALKSIAAISTTGAVNLAMAADFLRRLLVTAVYEMMWKPTRLSK